MVDVIVPGSHNTIPFTEGMSVLDLIIENAERKERKDDMFDNLIEWYDEYMFLDLDDKETIASFDVPLPLAGE